MDDRAAKGAHMSAQRLFYGFRDTMGFPHGKRRIDRDMQVGKDLMAHPPGAHLMYPAHSVNVQGRVFDGGHDLRLDPVNHAV
jgi:hypothetical protein